MKKLSKSEASQLKGREAQLYTECLMAEAGREIAEARADAAITTAASIAVSAENQRAAAENARLDKAFGVYTDPVTGAITPRDKLVRVVEDRGASQVFGVLRPAPRGR